MDRKRIFRILKTLERRCRRRITATGVWVDSAPGLRTNADFAKRKGDAATRYSLREKFTDIVVGWRRCFVDEAPFSSLFEILHLAVRTSGRMNLENRGPI